MKIKHPPKLILFCVIAFVAVFIPVILFHPTNNSSSFGGRDKFADFVKKLRKLTLVTFTIEGKVIDQHCNPVPKPNIFFSQRDSISFDGSGNTFGDLTGKEDGTFTVSGVGAAARIVASKEGYLPLPDSEATFSRIKEPAPYLQEAPFPKKPITLRLHKPEDADSLVHFVRKTNLPVSPEAQYCLGIPSFQPVDCEQADIIITFVNKDAGNTNRAPDTIQITYPGGGAVPKSIMFDDMYDYHPPQDGYREVTHAPLLYTPNDFEKESYTLVYFKTRKGIYGKMNIDSPGGHFIAEEYFLNFYGVINNSGRPLLESPDHIALNDDRKRDFEWQPDIPPCIYVNPHLPITLEERLKGLQDCLRNRRRPSSPTGVYDEESLKNSSDIQNAIADIIREQNRRNFP